MDTEYGNDFDTDSIDKLALRKKALEQKAVTFIRRFSGQLTATTTSVQCQNVITPEYWIACISTSNTNVTSSVLITATQQTGQDDTWTANCITNSAPGPQQKYIIPASHHIFTLSANLTGLNTIRYTIYAIRGYNPLFVGVNTD